MFFVTLDDVCSHPFTGFLWSICGPFSIGADVAYGQIVKFYDAEPISGWWKKPLTEMRLATFNARAETVAEKPMFRDSFKRRRCLMPASGYYEWKTTPEGKQPYYFTRRDGAVMAIAAIQDAWG